MPWINKPAIPGASTEASFCGGIDDDDDVGEAEDMMLYPKTEFPDAERRGKKEDDPSVRMRAQSVMNGTAHCQLRQQTILSVVPGGLGWPPLSRR